jgi:hypothetical protein
VTEDEFEGRVARQNEVFTEEVLRAQDGKTVPLTDRLGGNVIGEATFRYDMKTGDLMADFKVDDPKVAEFLKGDPPSIFG